MAAAALLAMAGGRFGRRAALRGLLSVATTSVVVNLPVKLLVRRRRPGHEPLLRWVASRPPARTHSFPSGHAASAAAFAAATAIEMPPLAIPFGALAAGVAWARVYDGVHHLGDVVGGAAVGAGVALGSRQLWPVAPHAPADERSRLKRVAAEPYPTGKGLTLVVNPSAGWAHPLARDLADVLCAELPDAQVIQLQEGDDLPAILERAASDAQVLAVAGGDGSVNAAAAVAHDHRLPLMVVPAGTLNHFARDLALTTPADAIAAVRAGHAVAVDLARIDGQPFLNTASFGAYVDLVDARERLEGTIGKWPAVFVALWRVLRRSDPVDVEIDGEHRRLWMIFIGNCRYQPPGFTPSWRERMDDGQLDVRMVDATSPYSRTRLLLAVLTGRLARCTSYEQRFVRIMRVRSRQGPLRLARDGEVFDGSVEFSVDKRDEPLVVYRPLPES